MPPTLSEDRVTDQRCSAELLLAMPVLTETLFGLWISVALLWVNVALLWVSVALMSCCLKGRFLLRHFSPRPS